MFSRKPNPGQQSGTKKTSSIPFLNRSPEMPSSSNSNSEHDSFASNSSPHSTRRISIPASRRLTAITEDSNFSSTTSAGAADAAAFTPATAAATTPNLPARNPLRANMPPLPQTPPRNRTPPRWSAGTRRISRFSEDTDSERGMVGGGGPAASAMGGPPPAYEWVHDPSEEDIVGSGINPADDEKLAELRAGGLGDKRNQNKKNNKRRGGWGRLALLVVVLVIVAIALGVGLGVGLARPGNNGSSDDGGSDGSSPTSATPAPSSSPIPTLPATARFFPVGTYSIPAQLKTIQTSCVSNAATWSCYPGQTGETGTFDWTIANTSSTYANANTTLTTSSSGVPANLTVAATKDVFGITFTKQALTYISPQGNASDARLVFEFSMTKSVIPSVALTPSGQATECLFENTSFTGILYLSAQQAGTGSGSSDTDWPYAVEVSQSVAGGADVPSCSFTDGGAVVGQGSEPSSETCLCGYRNF